MELWEGADLNQAKILLADEATKLLHGEECLSSIHETVQSLFSAGGGSNLDSLPKVTLDGDYSDKIAKGVLLVVDLVLKAELAPSKNEAKKLIRNGGIRVNDAKVVDEFAIVSTADFDSDKRLKLSAGKKKHILVVMP